MLKNLRSIAAILFFLTPIYASAQFSRDEIARYKTQAKNVTIIRDHWGIPHIYGKSDADAVFGLLYAQCEENFSGVEENFLAILGRLSEIKGESKIYEDLKMQLIYDAAAASADYKKSPSWLKKLMIAAADGINFYIYKHPESKPKVLGRIEPWMFLLRTDGSFNPIETGGLTRKDVKEMYPLDLSTAYLTSPKQFYEKDHTGSNGFAVAPSRTANKNAMLYINPHVSFYCRSEVQMVSEEGLNVYGAVTWGTFFVYQGFNEHCGWMHTSTFADAVDLYAEKIAKKEGKFYFEFDGKSFPVKSKPVVIRYKKDNTLLGQSFTTYSTVQGPVIGKRNGNWLAIKEKNRSMDGLIQSWLRTKAGSFDEFKQTMELRANISNNTVYADDKGNIAYWHGNFMPKRNPAFDYSSVVDGSTSATDWKGLHSIDEMVHVYNPASGWIQSCNSTPFNVSGNSSPLKENYPVYMAPDGENFRGINAANLLGKHTALTIDKMIDFIGYDSYLAIYDSLVPALVNAYDVLRPGDTLRQQLEEPVKLLKDWDRKSAKYSTATTLAFEWTVNLFKKADPLLPEMKSYQESHDLIYVSEVLKTLKPLELLTLMIQTQTELKSKYGTWKVSWGDVNRYQRTADGKFDDNRPSIPVGIANGFLGCLPSFYTYPKPDSKKSYGEDGNSFVACVEFGPKVKAKSVRPGGQSFDPADKHYTDQAEMFIDGKFKDVLFYKEDVEKHIERKYHPGDY